MHVKRWLKGLSKMLNLMKQNNEVMVSKNFEKGKVNHIM